MILLDNDVAVHVVEILAGHTARDAVMERLDHLTAVHECLDGHARNHVLADCAVDLADDQLLRDIDHSSGQVTGVCGTKSRIGQSLSCAVSGHEVFQNIQSFTEVRGDRQLDRTAGRICHQASHAGQLLDLLIGTAGTGVSHHEDVVVLIQRRQQRIRQLGIGLGPGVDDGLVTLFLGEESSSVVLGDLVDGLLCLCKKGRLLLRHRDVRDGNGQGCQRGLLVTHGLDVIENLCALERSMLVDDLLQNALEVLLLDQEIDLRKNQVLLLGTVNIPQVLRNDLIEHHAADVRGDEAGNLLSVGSGLLDTHLELRVHRDVVVLERHQRFIVILEDHAFSGLTVTLLCDVVDTKDHIL